LVHRFQRHFIQSHPRQPGKLGDRWFDIDKYYELSIMALNKKYLPLLAILPVIFTVYLYDGMSFQEQVATTQSGVVGHVTVIHRDLNDNIKAYSQSDNIVVNIGENCMAKLLFDNVPGAAGNTVCTGANTVGYRYIGLEAVGTATAADDRDLNLESGSAGLDVPLYSSATWTNSTGTGAGSHVEVALAATFTNSGASDEIFGAGLFNATAIATRGMFAHTLFASSAVVDTSDTLTVTWTISVGGGTVD
jgi:hypothetical protein